MMKKKVLITGASRGIGLEIARNFLEAGFNVVGTRTAIKKQYPLDIDWIYGDFSKYKDIEDCSQKFKKFQPDILINNAGINNINKFVKIDSDDFLKTHLVNVFAPFKFCQSVIPKMKLNKWGRIINISSIWGKIGKQYRASYMASKFALDGITLAIAAEHTKDGILCNCLSPGFTNTELTRKNLNDKDISSIKRNIPIKRLAEPKEIAKFVFWLASEDNTYVSGQNIAIDGGYTRV